MADTLKKPIPVILDTDIGDDIDDTWALAMMLYSPELDVKLVVSDTQDTRWRAKIIAKMLEVGGRTDVPVGIGIPQPCDPPTKGQALWVADYDLKSYPGTLLEDGVQAIIDTIMVSPDPVTLICIGPMPNIAEALRREPGIASRAHFVGMHGRIHRHHGGVEGAIAEWNVVCDVAACQQVFAAPWLSLTITPLDTCGVVQFKGERFSRARNTNDPLLAAVIENYRLWLGGTMKDESSILFDTVAVHLAYSTEYLKMERMGIRVTDDGFTVPDEAAPQLNVAIDWTDLEGYQDYLLDRLEHLR
jgi:inosine-uridine nucleoside N-ribohydrolase